MSQTIICPNPRCQRELEPFTDKCPYCGREGLNVLFLTKPNPPPRPNPPKPKPAPGPKPPKSRYSPSRVSKPLPKAHVFAGFQCMWILREDGKLYKLDNTGALPRKVLEDNLSCDMAVGSDSFFYLDKDGKMNFWENGKTVFWQSDGIQPSTVSVGRNFALLLTASGELYRFDHQERRRIAADVRSAVAGETCAVYVTKDGTVKSYGGRHSFPEFQKVQEVYADGYSDTFLIQTYDKLYLWGDGSRNRGTDRCLLYTFTGSGSEDPECRLYEYGGYDENSPADQEIYHRLQERYGAGLSISRYGGEIDYNQKLPNVYGACYTYTFEDCVEAFGPVKWLDEPVPFDCGIEIGICSIHFGNTRFDRDEIKKVVRLKDGWGILGKDGTLSLIVEGNLFSTMSDVFDIAVTAQESVILSKQNGKVLCGLAAKLLQPGGSLREIST